MDYDILRPRSSHDTRSGLLLLGTSSEEVGLVSDLLVVDVCCRHHLRMVLLGLLLVLLTYRRQVYR